MKTAALLLLLSALITFAAAGSTPAGTTPATTATTPATTATTGAGTTPAASTPAASTPAASTPAASTPTGTTPAGTTPAGTTPAASTPAGTTPAASTPTGTTPAASTPAGTTPTGTTPAGTTPAASTSDSRTPVTSPAPTSTSNSSTFTSFIPPTSGPQPPSTPPIPPGVFCLNTTITITTGPCAANFSTMTVRWCNKAYFFQVQDELNAFAQNISNAVSAPVTQLYQELNTTFCKNVLGTILTPANVAVDLHCLAQQARALACTETIANTVGCSMHPPPSCGLCGKSAELNCGVPASSPAVKAECNKFCSPNGFAPLQCQTVNFAAPTCPAQIPGVTTCAISQAGANLEFNYLEKAGSSANSLQVWANRTYCHFGGGSVNPTVNTSIACEELAISQSCSPVHCTNNLNTLTPPQSRRSDEEDEENELSVSNAIVGPASSFATPICCTHCVNVYNQLCSGGNANTACGAKGCSTVNCYASKGAIIGGNTLLPTPTPSPSGGGGIGPGGIAGIVIALLLVVGGATGFYIYRKKMQQNRDTALREYSSFPGGASA